MGILRTFSNFLEEKKFVDRGECLSYDEIKDILDIYIKHQDILIGNIDVKFRADSVYHMLLELPYHKKQNLKTRNVKEVLSLLSSLGNTPVELPNNGGKTCPIAYGFNEIFSDFRTSTNQYMKVLYVVDLICKNQTTEPFAVYEVKIKWKDRLRTE